MMKPSEEERQARVTEIAQRLGETQPAPISQIRRIVRHMSADQVDAWIEAAEGIEANGGELLPNGSRRRTLGGIFFRVARNGMTPEQRAVIFLTPWGKNKKKPKPPPTTQPPQDTIPSAPVLQPASWDDRDSSITEATQQPGKATTVKITVIGMIGKAVERQGYTLLTLQHDGKLPALPKGIPTPAQALPTSYILYIGSKQWTKVKDALGTPDDVLIAEGIPMIDPTYNAITVFVTNTTTKRMQAAKREGQAGQAG